MKSNTSAYRQIFDLAKRSPVLLTGLVAASLFGTLCEGLGIGLILPLMSNFPFEISALSKISILEGLSEFINGLELKGRIRFAAVTLVLIVLMRSIFAYFSTMFAVYLQVKTESALQKQIFSQILEVQISFLHQERQGNLLETLARHTQHTGALILALANGLIHCFTVVIYICLALLVSWQLTCIAIVLFLILLRLTNQGFSQRIRILSRQQKTSGSQFTSTLTEQLSALHLTHLFAREKHSLDCMLKTQQKYYSDRIQASKLVNLTAPSSNFFSALALGLLLFASTFLLKNQSPQEWIGQISLFLIISFRLIAPASALNRVKGQMDNQLPYLQSVIDFLRRDDKPYLENGTIHFEHLKTKISFKNVTFKYHANEGRILEDVSIDIPKGQMTAIVGPSGSGKSTLVNLVARLYDPEKGDVLIDGTNLREFDITSWRSQLAVINQDVFLFNDSVRANLKFAKPTATDEEIFHATRLAQAHDFITKLSEGYDTMLGDRGVRLSGGQRQRIAIARAILVNPQLLILDEATSDLDSKTERALQEAIEQYYHGHTLLVIAHRLSTIQKADNIIVLEKGKVAEQGTHAELINNQKQYSLLIQAQYK